MLTFDDAVKSHRTFVAPLLKELGFGATFFVTYNWMDDTENFMTWEEIGEVHDMGFEIGNHSWTHGRFAHMDGPTTEREVTETQDAIERLTGSSPRWFRPPRGQVTGASVAACAAHGLDTALWTLRFGVEEPDEVPDVDDLCERIQPGDIVLFHDGLGHGSEPTSSGDPDKRRRRVADAGALDDLLGRLVADGWELVTLSDLVDGAGGGPSA